MLPQQQKHRKLPQCQCRVAYKCSICWILGLGYTSPRNRLLGRYRITGKHSVIADLSNCRCALFACSVKTCQRTLTVANILGILGHHISNGGSTRCSFGNVVLQAKSVRHRGVLNGKAVDFRDGVQACSPKHEDILCTIIAWPPQSPTPILP